MIIQFSEKEKDLGPSTLTTVFFNWAAAKLASSLKPVLVSLNYANCLLKAINRHFEKNTIFTVFQANC